MLDQNLKLFYPTFFWYCKFPLIFFGVLAILCSCSVQEPAKIPERIRKLKNLIVTLADAKPIYQINLKKDRIYGETNKVIIGVLGDFAVDDSGRVFMGDGQQKTIDVFEPDGRYLTHIGRKGRGPGEFEVSPAINITSNRLYAVDYMTFRISAFSLDSLELVQTMNINMSDKDKIKTLNHYYLGELIPENNGKFLACFLKFVRKFPNVSGVEIDTIYQRYYPLNKKGRFIPKQILKLKQRPYVTRPYYGQTVLVDGYPFLAKPVVVVSDSDLIYTANSEDFLIKVYDSKGKYRRSFFCPYKKVTLTKTAAIESISALYGHSSLNQRELHYKIESNNYAVRHLTLPQTWPALYDMKIDSHDRLWIATIVNSKKVYQWWVLNQNGKLLTRFTWPRDKPIEVIKNGYIYTKETDATTGIQKVVRYRIAMEK